MDKQVSVTVDEEREHKSGAEFDSYQLSLTHRLLGC